MNIPSNPVPDGKQLFLSNRRSTSKATRTYRELVKKKILKQERRVHLKLQKSHEYRRLRSMVPSIAKKVHVPKVTVIEEAIRYIDHLHNALLTRLRTRGLPSCLQGMNIDINSFDHSQIQELVHHLMLNSNTPSTGHPVSLSGSVCERTRVVPSYLLRKGKKLQSLNTSL
ncbi:uncharacterized protein LOC143248563 [Tachypleus tridentatus]|uniref:uncharacterized protein LOC143248563 n=1 Tax=Tachypleus tridentatus TaxID=6853 RepID=UPI003FD0DE1B